MEALDQYFAPLTPPQAPAEADPIAGVMDRMNESFFGGRMPPSRVVADQKGAINFLTQHALSMGEQSRQTGAGDSMQLANPNDPTSDRTHGVVSDQQWQQVASQVRQNFPSIDPESLKDAYATVRRQARQAGAIDFYRQMFQSGADDPQRSGRARVLAALPFSTVPIINATRTTAAANAIRSNQASDQDYAVLGAFLADQDVDKKKGWGERVLNLLEGLPGFAAEFAATGGAFSATQMATSRAIATRLGEGLASRVVSGAAGIAAQTAMNPVGIARSTAEQLTPEIAANSQAVAIGPERGFGGALARGILDQAIEMGTERAGGLVDRIPGLGRFTRGEGTITRRLAVNGIPGEISEELLGDVLRGMTGVRQDYGTVGDIASGRFGEAASNIGAMAVAFGAYGHASRLADRVRTGNLPAGGPPLLSMPPLGDFATAAEIDRHAEVAQRVEVRNQAAVVHWATTAPLNEVREWAAVYPSLDDVAEKRARFAAKPAAREASLPAAAEIVGSIEHMKPQGPEPGVQEPEAQAAPAAPPPVEQQSAQPPAPAPETSNVDIPPAPTGQNLTTGETASTAPQTAPEDPNAQEPARTSPEALAQPGSGLSDASSDQPVTTSPTKPVVTQPLPRRSSANLKGFEHDALKMAANSLGVSPAGGAAAIRKRLGKTSAGQKALAGLPGLQDVMRRMAEMDLVEGKTPVPAEFATAMAASSAHTSEKAALEAVLSGLSFDKAAALRTSEGTPLVAMKGTPGKSVSHETARKYAERAFEQIKKENPGKWEQYPKLTYYLLEKQTERADALSSQMGGEAITPSVAEEVEAAEAAVVDELARAAEERDLYREELERKGKANGRPDVQADVERASEEELADYRSKRRAGAPARLQGPAQTPASASATQGATVPASAATAPTAAQSPLSRFLSEESGTLYVPSAELIGEWLSGFRKAPAKASTELAKARAQVNPTGNANPTAATAREAVLANARAAGLEFRQRADDNKAIATDIAADVNKKRARLGLSPVRPGDDLRTVIARADQNVQPWAEEIATQGAFVLEQAADGTRTKRTIGKPAAWIYEGMNYKPEDFKPFGTGVLDSLKRKFGFPVEQGASRLNTMLVALHAVHQVERGQAMLDKYLTFITPEQEAVAARLLNTVSTEQLKAFDAYVEHERANDPEFFSNANESLRRLAQLNDWTLETLQSVGWYSAEDVARIKRDFPDYLSMARIIEGDELRKGGGSEIKPGWEKKRHGSDKQILDPIRSLESRYAQTAVIVAKQLKDQALLEAARSLEGDYLKPASITPEVRLTDIAEKLTALGIDKAHQTDLIGVIGPELIEHFGAPAWNANGQNFYIMRENGKRVAMEITSKPLYELMTSNQEATAIVAGATRFVTAIPGLAQLPKIVKWGATTGNLVFPVRNMIRDPWHAFQNSEKPFLPTLGRLILGLRDSLVASGQTAFGKQLTDPFAKLYFEATGQGLREFAYTKGGAGAEAIGKLKGESSTLRKTVKVAHKVQEVLELIGFAEHGPRLAAFGETLEDMGYTKTEVAAAMKADPTASPIPIDVLFHALQKAAERTTDFSRQGIDVREFNRIVPFFSPQIAGMSQEIRNWDGAASELKQGKFGPKSKAMLGSLALYLGAELMHWWRYKDDEWYKNLPPHLRYGWWILGQTKDGGTWGLPKPQGIMKMIGAYFQESLRTASSSDPRFGMATRDVIDQAMPRLLPIGIGEAVQVATNRDWRGANIVPARDLRELDAWEQFRRHQLPYVLDQMTGGLASARVLRGPLEAFQSSKSEPAQPVTEYFSRLEAVTGAHARAKRLNQPLPPEQAREYARLHVVEQIIRRLSREARGELGPMPTPERLREIRQRQNALARRALGLAPA